MLKHIPVLIAVLVAVSVAVVSPPKSADKQSARAAHAEDTVVGLGALTHKGVRIMGTGSYLDESTILTNCHVAGVFTKYASLPLGWTPVARGHDGVLHEVYSVYCDPVIDLAIVKLRWPNYDAKPIRLGDTPSPGSDVWSAGYGQGKPMQYKTGIMGYPSAPADFTWWNTQQVTLPVIGGDSGSPVFSEDGTVGCIVNSGDMAFTMRWVRIPLADRSYCIHSHAINLFLMEYNGKIPRRENHEPTRL